MLILYEILSNQFISLSSRNDQISNIKRYIFYKYYYCLVIIMKMNALDRLSCDIYQPISTFVLKTYSILAVLFS